MSIEVTIRDTETDQSVTQTVTDDVLVITDGTCYVSSISDYPKSGTQTFTVKGRGGRS